MPCRYRLGSNAIVQIEICSLEVAPVMKKLMTAVIAILMLAGALCAISGATPVSSFHSVAIVGEGSSPFPVLLSSSGSDSEPTVANHF